MNVRRRVEFEPRVAEALGAVSTALEPFSGEYVMEVVVVFFPVDGKDDEVVDAFCAKSRVGSFRSRAQ